MYQSDYDYNRPAVPPLYPMEPCRPPVHMPVMPDESYMHEPYMPMPHHMPMCPMMDPRFRECVQVCMMQCGGGHREYPMSMGRPPIHSMDMNELDPYYPTDME